VKTLLSLLARFGRARRGATAVEFALIAPVLVGLMFVMLETALVFLTSTGLENAAERAARQIRTGEFQSSGAVTKDDFKGLVCSNMGWLPDCAANLYVEARTFSDFGDLAAAPPPDLTQFGEHPPPCWSVGKAADIVLVRAWYRWKLFTPILSAAMDDTGDGYRLISTTTAFRNEPYDDNPAKGASC
jgi:Flp pilus assembly protein TadG